MSEIVSCSRCRDADSLMILNESEFQPCGRSSQEVASEQIAKAMELGNQRFEWVHKRFTGEEFYAEVLLSPGIWNGELVLQALVRDISESKRLQRDLEAALEEAKRAGNAKLEFLAVMSHEIRTPIQGLLGLNELLAGSELDEDQREHVSLALRSTRALLGTVNNVLEFSAALRRRCARQTDPAQPPWKRDQVHGARPREDDQPSGTWRGRWLELAGSCV